MRSERVLRSFAALADGAPAPRTDVVGDCPFAWTALDALTYFDTIAAHGRLRPGDDESAGALKTLRTIAAERSGESVR